MQTAREALEANQGHVVRELVAGLHAADVAYLLEQLSPEERRAVPRLHQGRSSRRRRSPTSTRTCARRCSTRSGPRRSPRPFSELDSDDALDVLEDLDEEAKQKILASVPVEERVILEQGLAYPEESAGRLMQRKLVAVPSYWTVGETIDFLRASDDLPDDFYDLFIVDPAHKPIGAVPLSRAMRTQAAGEADGDDGDRAAQHPRRPWTRRRWPTCSGSTAWPRRRWWTRTAGCVGVITVDDVVHVIEEETEEDLMGLGGVGESDFHAPALVTAWRRIRWLVVTLINTLIASSVISQFDATIQQIVALAVLMPIVAAMGGNAGMQVVTVTVRALATHDLSPGSNLLRAVGKEILVAGVNAACFALDHGRHRLGLVPRLASGRRAGRRHDLQHDVGGAGRHADPARRQPPRLGPGRQRRAPSSRPRPTCSASSRSSGWRRYSSFRSGGVQHENSKFKAIVFCVGRPVGGAVAVGCPTCARCGR